MKKTRLLFSLVMFCITFAALTFGIFAATSVSYALSGQIEYEVTDAFVNITSSVYKYTTGPLDQTGLDNLGAEARTSVSNLTSLNNTNTYSTLTGGSPTHNYGTLDFVFDNTSANKAYAYVFVITITNLSPDQKVWAQVNTLPSVTNVLTYKSLAQANITTSLSKSLVVAVGVNEWQKKVTFSDFNFSITVTSGDLPNNVEAYNVLPQRYQEVEYIESHGGQYIDTGYYPNNNTKVVADLKISVLHTNFYAFFGGRNTNNTNTFSLVVGITQGSPMANLCTGYGNENYDLCLNGIFDELQADYNYHIVKDKNVLYINNSLIRTQPEATFVSPKTMYIFAANQTTVQYNNYCSYIKMYSFTIYDNDILTANYIPVYDTTNSVYGFYDMVSETFFGNASGNGAFTGGSFV